MTISGVLAVRDEAEMIAGALASLAFCDEIVVLIDDRTSDDTAAIARAAGAQVHHAHFETFDRFKNAAIDLAHGDWVVCCDADERVTPALAREIQATVGAPSPHWALKAPRINYFWGRRMSHGAWPETQIKVFRRDRVRYSGALHEVPDVPPQRVGELCGEWWHFSHRSIAANLQKTANYGTIWAAERAAAGAPPVRFRGALAWMAAEFVRRAIIGSGWRDGMPGLIEVVYQPFSVFCHRISLWEAQQQADIARRYAELERALETHP